MIHYNFKTTWQFEASLEEVWSVILLAEQWPSWWNGVIDVKLIENGTSDGLNSIREFTFKSALPYELTFQSTVVYIEHLSCVQGKAKGDLEGVGTWYFSQENEITTVVYDWNVRTNKWWMKILAPIARPVFRWNHDVLMKRGGAGLASKLGCHHTVKNELV